MLARTVRRCQHPRVAVETGDPGPGGSGTAPAGSGLRRNSVGLSGVVGQSLSAMGLSGVIGTSVPVVAEQAGAGGWLTWVIAAVVMTFVALSIAVLARRYATTGGLYGLTSRALGPLGGMLTGWLMVALVGLAAGTGVLSFGIYFCQFLGDVGIGYGRLTLTVTSVVMLLLCWFLARVGARPAAWVMFVTGIAATVALLVVFVVVLVHTKGSVIDPEQLHLKGVTLALVVSNVVLAVGAFGGFESATVYGQEATNARRAIPIAMVLSVGLGGLIWMFSSYTLFLGFQHAGIAIQSSPAPMGTLADIAGIGWYRPVVDLALSFTIGASIIAVFTWVARMMFTMSREGILPSSLQRIHPRYQTPTIGLNLAVVVWLTLVVAMGATSANPLATYGDVIGEMSGFPLLLVYALICVAAIVHLVRQGRRVSAGIACGVLGALGMSYVFYRNIVPWPPKPASIVVVIFFVLCGTVTFVYLRLRRRAASWLPQIGASVDADTAAVEAAP